MAAKERVGQVVSDKMDKTVVVAVESRVPHPKYGKIMVRTRRFKAHDEENKCKTGDQVKIRETRPLSRTKHWIVADILNQVSEAESKVVAQAEAIPSTQSAEPVQVEEAAAPPEALATQPVEEAVQVEAEQLEAAPPAQAAQAEATPVPEQTAEEEAAETAPSAQAEVAQALEQTPEAPQAEETES